MIPRILHHVWVNPPIPEHLAAYISSWKLNHPQWEHKLWHGYDASFDDEHTLRPWYEKATTPSMQADIIRLSAVWNYGGVYVDADIECHRPIDGLLEGCDAFFASEYDAKVYGKDGPSGITSGIFGASPGHPAILELINETVVAKRKWLSKRRRIFWRGKSLDFVELLECSTGVFRHVAHRRSDVRILEQKIFQALLPHEYAAGARDSHPDAYGTHWFEGSWLK